MSSKGDQIVDTAANSNEGKELSVPLSVSVSCHFINLVCVLPNFLSPLQNQKYSQFHLHQPNTQTNRQTESDRQIGWKLLSTFGTVVTLGDPYRYSRPNSCSPVLLYLTVLMGILRLTGMSNTIRVARVDPNSICSSRSTSAELTSQFIQDSRFAITQMTYFTLKTANVAEKGLVCRYD